MRHILISVLLALFVGGCFFFFAFFSSRDRALVFESAETIEVDGIVREYRVYAPPQTTSMPLVVALHGYKTDSSKRMELYTGLSHLAAQKGFVVVYPSGIDHSWNGDFCCGTAQETNVDDVAFIRTLIARITADYPINRKKIYVVGMSNGGVMAQRLLAELPDVFAAGAAVMSGVGDNDAQLDITAATAPLLLIQGKQDRYVPLTASLRGMTDEYEFLSAQETRDIWAAHYDLGAPTVLSYGTLDMYQYGDVAAPQLLSYVYDTTHRWPEWRFTNPFVRVPDSTEQVWQFLSSHTK